MTHAKLKMRPSTETTKCWDNLTLVVNDTGTAIPFIVFKNRETALELFHTLTLAEFDGIEGPLTVDIDGREVEFSTDAREVVSQVLNEFIGDFFTAVELEMD